MTLDDAAVGMKVRCTNPEHRLAEEHAAHPVGGPRTVNEPGELPNLTWAYTTLCEHIDHWRVGRPPPPPWMERQRATVVQVIRASKDAIAERDRLLAEYDILTLGAQALREELTVLQTGYAALVAAAWAYLAHRDTLWWDPPQDANVIAMWSRDDRIEDDLAEALRAALPKETDDGPE